MISISLGSAYMHLDVGTLEEFCTGTTVRTTGGPVSIHAFNRSILSVSDCGVLQAIYLAFVLTRSK